MSTLEPRVVFVTRQSEYDRMLATHATRGQAEFFLKSRGQDLAVVEKRMEVQSATLLRAKQSVPDDWMMSDVRRKDLDRFLFNDNDIVVAIGQDGLVANLAKYLDGQPVVGISPEDGSSEGILTPLCVDTLPRLLPKVAARDIELQDRTMVEAKMDDGQKITALNELFIGHRSHQSARYKLSYGEQHELQSSSGIIVSTGTGLTGWARSIMTATHREIKVQAEEKRAVYFAREPWPSHNTGTELTYGEIDATHAMQLTSRMNEGGVIFADGIEQDFLLFDWGRIANIGVSEQVLHMVRG